MVFYSIAKYVTSHLLIKIYINCLGSVNTNPSLVTGGMNGGNGGNGGDTKFGNIITLPGGKGGAPEPEHITAITYLTPIGQVQLCVFPLDIYKLPCIL